MVLSAGFRASLLVAVSVQVGESSEWTEMGKLFCASQVPGPLPHPGNFRGFAFSVGKARLRVPTVLPGAPRGLPTWHRVLVPLRGGMSK